MAYVAMERKSKAAAGRVAAAYLVFAVCVCLFFLCFVDCKVGAPTTAKQTPIIFGGRWTPEGDAHNSIILS